MPGGVSAPTPRPWFWALAQAGHGPDWHFFARFEDAPGLATAVSRGLSDGFVRDVDFREPGGATPPHVRRYVDRHTAERVLEMRATGRTAPVWYSGEVTVASGTLHLVHVLAGDLYDETPLLVALSADPTLGLGAWQVCYGGDFAGEVAAGQGEATLREYLGLPAR